MEEMDGSLLRHHVAAFRLIPYVQRQDLDDWATEVGLETVDRSPQEASDDGNQINTGTTDSSTSAPL